MQEARERAAAAGLNVLRATASPLEQDFPFGLVRQLLDPVLAGGRRRAARRPGRGSVGPGAAAGAAQRREEGIAILEDAVALLERSAIPLQHGYALHDLGAALRDAGRREDAREPLRKALQIAEEVAVTRLATMTRKSLVDVGTRPRRAAVGGSDALTPSERRVAALAVQGLSNREIAESLWVTRKTVELHLGNAYSKLGIRSRSQLPCELVASVEEPAA